MTVLGTASKVYAGNVAAVAVYAGSVKVWPTHPPAWWEDTAAGLLLHLPGGLAQDGATVVVDIPPGPVPTQPGWVLGRAYANPSARPLVEVGAVSRNVFDPAWTGLTAGRAVAEWGGMRMEFTTPGGDLYARVVGPTP